MIEFAEETDILIRAREFVFQKWIERSAEIRPHGPAPKDLSSACKFASLFAQSVFGGAIRGNWHHQYVLNHNGEIVDLCRFSNDIVKIQEKNLDPWFHSPIFFAEPEYIASIDSCRSRVKKWIEEWNLYHEQSNKNDENLSKNEIAMGELDRKSRELMTLMNHVLKIQKLFKHNKKIDAIKLLLSEPSALPGNMPVPYVEYLKKVQTRNMVDQEIARLRKNLDVNRDECISLINPTWPSIEQIENKVFGRSKKTDNTLNPNI